MHTAITLSPIKRQRAHEEVTPKVSCTTVKKTVIRRIDMVSGYSRMVVYVHRQHGVSSDVIIQVLHLRSHLPASFQIPACSATLAARL